MSAEDKWIETEMDFYGLLNNILCLETAVCPLVIYQYISYCFRKQKTNLSLFNKPILNLKKGSSVCGIYNNG